MRVILLGRKLYYFDLPEKVDGSYRMPFGDDSNESLIDIEAKDNQWIMKSNDETSILYNNGFVNEMPLKVDSFYTLQRNNMQLILYTTKTFDDSFKLYYPGDSCNLKIGNYADCDINYGVMYMNGVVASLAMQNGHWIFTKTNELMCFLNNNVLSQTNISLKNGDTIFLYGLKLAVFNNYLMVNNPDNLVTVNSIALQVVDSNYSFDKSKLTEVKEKDLYEEKDYYLKSPRISRVVEEKEIEIVPPPSPATVDEPSFIAVLGPMLATSSVSFITIMDLIRKINSGETTLDKSWPQLFTALVMILSTVLWPLISRKFKNKQKQEKENKRTKKYTAYLNKKEHEIDLELGNEEAVLNDSFPSYKDAINTILNKSSKLWERKNEQKDFLQVKLGYGDVDSYIKLSYKADDFTLDEDVLKSKLDAIAEKSKTLKNVPVTFSFLENKITAIMDNSSHKAYMLTKSILVQLMAYHSYDELKFVIVTNGDNLDFWDKLKLCPYCFNNEKTIRYFASNRDERTELNKILFEEAQARNEISAENSKANKKTLLVPHYLVITDDVQSLIKMDFFNFVLDSEYELDFSFIVLEDRISQLPSKCTDFISLGTYSSDLFEIDIDNNSHQVFQDELDTDFDIGRCCKVLSNIPIELNTSNRFLPNSLSFLEMYNVGKVEQLNLLNRWKQNNPIKSLKAQVGVDDLQEPIYLDLHEKAHGPHGLIAGMTGSGKSEFIITYILSMAINYSPEEASFILIDYKGGGLVGAFENQKTGAVLPHLAGTITNLDKAEMNRTLVSIDSELRRRQKVFNEARDALGESTIDIYKYQRLHREGKIKDPVSHLFIISDEFAELKSQQPEFMDNLISAARIGRSLGVHLILATQKPSGVVNDQIWSNTKFRVCLKVQDKTDSHEMIKVPDAAEIKQAGRFYFQVGYNEIFMLGQSGWAGAQYSPSDQMKKDYDRSVSFINNMGEVIESLENTANKKKATPMGDELTNIVKYIIETAKKENIVARRMWLEKIPEVIYVNNLINKYGIRPDLNNMIAIVGERDDPNNQFQDILTIPIFESGNTILYSVSGSDKEMVLKSLIYSTACLYTAKDINWYIVDYGSEALRTFSKLPHVGDMVFSGEKEKLTNLFKMLDEEIERRKKKFSNYSGSYAQYCRQSGDRLPLIGVIINDFDAVDESDANFQDMLAQYTRDSERSGIFFVVTCSGYSSLRGKLRQSLHNVFALEMNSREDYTTIVGNWKKVCLFDYSGRGLVKLNEVYEFQTATVFPEERFQEYMAKFLENVKTVNPTKAKKIPILPDRISISMLQDELTGLDSIPIGISKSTLETVRLNILDSSGLIVGASELASTSNVIKFLSREIKLTNKARIIVIDPTKAYEKYNNMFDKYVVDNLDNIEQEVLSFADESHSMGLNSIVIVTEPAKLKIKVQASILDKFSKSLKARDDIKVIISLSNESRGMDFDIWFVNLINKQNGIWVGPGFVDQDFIRVSSLDREMRQVITEEFGWRVKNSKYGLVKLIDSEMVDENEK